MVYSDLSGRTNLVTCWHTDMSNELQSPTRLIAGLAAILTFQFAQIAENHDVHVFDKWETSCSGIAEYA